MNIRLVVSSLFVAAVCGVVTAQEFRASRAALEIAPSKIIQNSLEPPLPAGTYSIGAGGYFPTIDSAFRKLSADGIAGGVTLELIDTLYDATTNVSGSFTLVGPIAGAGPASRITIRPADNVAVTIKGNGETALLFENVSYCTVDGISLTGNTRLKVHALYNAAKALNDGLIFYVNSDFNVVQNITAATDDITRGAGAVCLWGISTGSPDSCLVSGVTVTSGCVGIYIAGSATVRPMGNVIRNNHVGSPSDSLIAWGIQNERADYTMIENNHVQNLRFTLLSVLNTQLGINTFASNNTIIRNNIVHNLRLKNVNSRISGIIASGGAAPNRGSNVWIYNNKVWDVSNTGATNAELDGITAWYQDSPRVYYNSVYLSEMTDTPPTVGSSAIHFPSTNIAPMIRNNILVNTRDDSLYSSVAIRMDAPTYLSDYNDLLVSSASSAYIAMLNGAGYKTLAGWQGLGKDVYSVSVMPPFLGPNDLHLGYASTLLADAAIPISGITTDIDGDVRPRAGHAFPDIGADEFSHPPGSVDDGIVGIPVTTSLAQNYPNPFNPETVIRYQLSVVSKADLRVYDLLGREVAVLVNEEKMPGMYTATWNAEGTVSGIYFYTLHAGGNVFTKKMILMR